MPPQFIHNLPSFKHFEDWNISYFKGDIHRHFASSLLTKFMSCWYMLTWGLGEGRGRSSDAGNHWRGVKECLRYLNNPLCVITNLTTFFCVYWLSNKYRQVVVKTVWKVLSLLNNVGYITDRVCFVTQCLTNPNPSYFTQSI